MFYYSEIVTISIKFRHPSGGTILQIAEKPLCYCVMDISFSYWELEIMANMLYTTYAREDLVKGNSVLQYKLYEVFPGVPLQISSNDLGSGFVSKK